jgi:hypothetical protein
LPALLAATAAACAVQAQPTNFQPGQLAVLRAGDGEIRQQLKQAPLFIDQFDPKTFSLAPTFSLAIPTNGANAFFFNSHAATEGVLSRSDDHHLLVFAGYGGVNLLAKPGVPSLLDISRGVCTVDAAGAIRTILYQPEASAKKINPRGAVSDGKGSFWICGNAGATLCFTDNDAKKSVEFESVQNTRVMKIINHVLYASLNGADALAMDRTAGIYQFVDQTSTPTALPHQPEDSLSQVVPVANAYSKISGFDISPDQSVAYVADTAAGIQKYVKSGDHWKLAYNFSIPQNIPSTENHAEGCFGLAVDFSGPAPVIYATTTEGYGGTVNSNRVVSIVDTNATAVVRTVAQSPSDKIVFRGIDFTPEASH